MKKFKLIKTVAFAAITYAGYKTIKKYKELAKADTQKEKSVMVLLGESIPTRDDIQKDVENIKAYISEKTEELKSSKRECFFDDSDDDDGSTFSDVLDDLDVLDDEPVQNTVKEEEPKDKLQEEKKECNKNLGAIKLRSCLPDDEPEKEE